jgi:hypothetical protein
VTATPSDPKKVTFGSIVLIGFCVIIGLAIFGQIASGGRLKLDDPSDSASGAAASSAASVASSTAGSGATASNWSYSSDKDDMRGTTSRYASVDSDNTLSFGFPYQGETHGTLFLRRNPRLNVILQVERGQFLCDDYDHTTVAVRFDNHPVEHFGCTEPSDGRTTEIFLDGEARFLTQLKHASKVVIEAELFQEGRQQLTFSVGGLDWPGGKGGG